MFCANVIHIAPWAVAQGLFAGAGRHLRAGGRLFLYGPFRRDGAHNAPSNAAFDESLRRQNPEWGVRDTAELRELASRNKLAYQAHPRAAGEQRDPDVRAVVTVAGRIKAGGYWTWIRAGEGAVPTSPLERRGRSAAARWRYSGLKFSATPLMQ